MKSSATLADIVSASGLSRATVDRVLNNRPGVHRRTRDLVARVKQELESGTDRQPSGDGDASVRQRSRRNFDMIMQSGETFIASLTQRVDALKPRLDELGCNLRMTGFDVRSDAALVDAIASADSSDGFAVIAKNSEPALDILRALQARHKPVVAAISDVELSARSCYVGIDNRAAGQTAGFLMGRHLGSQAEASVAVVVGNLSYVCHEDREIGFRTMLRQRFPTVDVVDVLKGEDSADATYEATRKMLASHPDIDGIYNLSGGNEGLAQALADSGVVARPLFITHEVNSVTERLLRTMVIDYVITQDIDQILISIAEQLQLLAAHEKVVDQTLIPFHIECKYSL